MNYSKDQKEIERIRGEYQPREITKTDELKALDKKVRRPVEIFAYIFGSVSALVFGTGMCLAMKVIGANLPIAIGIIVGVAGMALCGVNYLVYKAWLKSRKRKYASEILGLCDDALNA